MYQIGDWVNITPEESVDECPILKQIVSVVGTEPQYWIGEDIYDIYGEEHIAPILLTDEILELNGWRREEDEDEELTKFIYTDILCPRETMLLGKWREHGDYDFRDFRIHYVHELQQAMRLWFTCNTEDLSAKEYKAIISKINNLKFK